MDRCWEEQSETGAHLWNTLPPIHRAEPFRSFGFIFKSCALPHLVAMLLPVSNNLRARRYQADVAPRLALLAFQWQIR